MAISTVLSRSREHNLRVVQQSRSFRSAQDFAGSPSVRFRSLQGDTLRSRLQNGSTCFRKKKADSLARASFPTHRRPTMNRCSSSRSILFVIATLLLTLNISATQKAKGDSSPSAAKTDYEVILKQLHFREIGPASMGGRIDDFAVVESNPDIIYVGAASGGVFKTTNGGTTWTPVFENEVTSTIGDVTIAPSDPSIVWVGTGEANNRQSSSWGNGVYKSTDGGKTWQHMGLAETHHIARIVIHPADPNIVYVAAVGRLWGPSQ